MNIPVFADLNYFFLGNFSPRPVPADHDDRCAKLGKSNGGRLSDPGIGASNDADFTDNVLHKSQLSNSALI